MKSKKVTMTVALISLLALGLTGPVPAQDEPPAWDGPPADSRWGGGPGWAQGACGFRSPGMRGMGARGRGGPRAQGLRVALRHLDLTESQREGIQGIFESECEEVRANQESMRSLGDDLRDQIENDPYDATAVRSKAAALAELRVEMAVLRARQAGRIRELLTPDQIERLEELRQMRETFRQERRGRFERRRRPGAWGS